MVREELCWTANVLSKVEEGLRGLCFMFHGMDVDQILTRAGLELCVLSQGFDVDWHSCVSAEEGAKAAMLCGECVVAVTPGDMTDRLACSLLRGAAESGLWDSDAPFLSEGLC